MRDSELNPVMKELRRREDSVTGATCVISSSLYAIVARRELHGSGGAACGKKFSY